MREKLLSDINEKTGFIYQLWEFHHIDKEAYIRLQQAINEIARHYFGLSDIPKWIIYELNRMLVAIFVIQSDVFSGLYKLNIPDDEYLDLCNHFNWLINKVIVPPEEIKNHVWWDDMKIEK